MDLVVQALVIGIVQGLTEFLPISSSAHLILLPPLLGWNDPFINSPAFVVMLHMGTLVALLVYFWSDLLRLARAALRVALERRIEGDPERRVAVLLAVSVLPAALVGFLLEEFVDVFFRERPLTIAGLLVVGAALLFVAERRGSRDRDMPDLRYRDALAIGGAQALALFPGISRSGVTIAAGLMLGLNRSEAARFAFLMGTPIIAGAGLWKVRELVTGEAGAFDPLVLITGLLAAALSGLAAIRFLLLFLRRFSTDLFVVYRIGFAATVAVLLLSAGV